MRIAYMLTSLGIGGAERQVIALAERMQARGHEVALIVLRPKEAREWPARIDVVRLEMTKSLPDIATGLARGRRFLRRFQPVVVHSHTFPANMLARALRLTGNASKVLSTIHNVYEGGWARMLAYRLSDGLSVQSTGVSEAVANRYYRMGAVPRGKCCVITNGIDSEMFAPGASPNGAAQEWMRGGRFVWLSAGRDVPAKDFDNLLAAFRHVCAEVPQCELWIAGQVSEARLQQMNGRDADDGVRWLGVCDDMRSVLSRADAFVLSSAWEGLPLVLGEAMAMEKPVVATDVGGVRELVGLCGLLVPAKDSVALAAAMLELMRLPESERGAMGRSARERICRHFDMNAKADEWEALYTQLLV